MSYECKILLDSISETGKRLTTFQVTFPRIVLAEWNTHRMFSRNSASSRAIPFDKQIKRILDNPFIPEKFPRNNKGMQPKEYYETGDTFETAKRRWLQARDSAIAIANELWELEVHKQIVNRLLEPFMWHTVIVTATEFDNFFKLRTHPDAQYEIKRIVDLMYSAYHWNWDCYSNQFNKEDFPYDNPEMGTIANIQKLKVGEWHCPLVFEEDLILLADYWKSASGDKYKYIVNLVGEGNLVVKELTKMISVARCARISYRTHNRKRDIEADMNLYERLRISGHWSPFEHVATPYFDEFLFELNLYSSNLWSGNFLGWKQYRKEFQDGNCTNFRKGI